MSPTLFIDFLARLILSQCVAAGIPGVTVGFHIDGHLTTPPSTSPNTQLLTTLMLLYADGIVLLTESETQLQQALTIAQRVFEQWGMQLSHIRTQAICLIQGFTGVCMKHTAGFGLGQMLEEDDQLHSQTCK
jgi:hypothetical protein